MTEWSSIHFLINNIPLIRYHMNKIVFKFKICSKITNKQSTNNLNINNHMSSFELKYINVNYLLSLWPTKWYDYHMFEHNYDKTIKHRHKITIIIYIFYLNCLIFDISLSICPSIRFVYHNQWNIVTLSSEFLLEHITYN